MTRKTQRCRMALSEAAGDKTAACSGGAMLGAPLTHDFAVISLSNRLTPWEIIERRLEYAAWADLSIVLYNPAIHGIPEHLRRACDILLRVLPENRPCAVARNIGGDGRQRLCTMGQLREADMVCTVFIGNETSRMIGENLITPRGYRNG